MPGVLGQSESGMHVAHRASSSAKRVLHVPLPSSTAGAPSVSSLPHLSFPSSMPGVLALWKKVRTRDEHRRRPTCTCRCRLQRRAPAPHHGRNESPQRGAMLVKLSLHRRVSEEAAARPEAGRAPSPPTRRPRTKQTLCPSSVSFAVCKCSFTCEASKNTFPHQQRSRLPPGPSEASAFDWRFASACLCAVYLIARTWCMPWILYHVQKKRMSRCHHYRGVPSMRQSKALPPNQR